MGNYHTGVGKVVLKEGVSREEIIAVLNDKGLMFFESEEFVVEGGVLKYEYYTKRPNYDALEVLRQFAAKKWAHYERDEHDDWRAPARKKTYYPNIRGRDDLVKISSTFFSVRNSYTD